MSDGAEELHVPADNSAGAVEKTNEQIWNEIVAEKQGDAPVEEVETPETDDVAEVEAELEDDPSEDDETNTPETDEGADGTEEEEQEDSAAQIERLNHALKSEKGRTAALQRKLERNRTKPETGNDPSRNDDEARGKRRDRMKEVAEEYGDILTPVIEEVEGLNSELDSLRSENAQRAQDDKDAIARELEAQGQTFLTEHPDGFDVVTQHRETFDAWIEDQPKVIRDLYETNRVEMVDGTGAALLVSHFKQALDEASDPEPTPEAKRLDSKRKRQLAGARANRAGGPQSSVSDTPADNAPSSDHWDYFVKKKGLQS